MTQATRLPLLLTVLLPLVQAARISNLRVTVANIRVDASPLCRLRGGQGGMITVRMRTADGIKRATVPADSTLMALQKAVAKEHKMPVARQKISKDKRRFGEEDADKSLSDLGIEHGAMLQLDLEPAAGDQKAAAAPPPPTSASGGGRRKRRGQTMADFEAERSEFEVVLETPGPATTQYLSVEPDAGKAFADFVLDNEFEERRIALLFGRWVDEEASGGKRGVLVDVLYEPPQECSEDTMAIEGTKEARSEVERATQLAKDLGLSLVGFAYAHPPRHHTLEAAELVHIVEQQSSAAKADPLAKELFVGVRFRAVYEGEPIDGDVTAEAYQPTTQAAELVGKSVLIDGPPTEEGELGQLALTPSSKLEFKIGPELVKTADGSYFVSRVHDMAKPYVPPDFGSFRHSFPIANRGQAPLRKFHLRTYMERQREAGLPFSTSIVDFQMLLHVSALLPSEMLTKLCSALVALPTAPRGKVRDAAQASIDDAERWLCKYAGVES